MTPSYLCLKEDDGQYGRQAYCLTRLLYIGVEMVGCSHIDQFKVGHACRSRAGTIRQQL